MFNKCQLCGNTDSRLAFLKNNYPHYQCQHCGSLYVYPRPSAEELVEFYRNSQENHLSQSCWGESHKHTWDLWRHSLDIARRYVGYGYLLDIGCGTGEFLSFAKLQGWSNLEGVEVIPEVAEYAKKLTHAPIYIEDFLEVNLQENFYSVISLWDVIEHLSDISLVLERIYRLLKPGGVIIIGTVNRDGISLKSFQKNSLTIMPPEHLTFFSQKGMDIILNCCNFRLIEQWSSLIYLREWLRFIPKSRKSDSQAQMKEYTKVRSQLTESKAFLRFMRLANGMLRVFNLGDELVAVAQKPSELEK
jgi:SAM-dependent methyltransferase